MTVDDQASVMRSRAWL